MFVTVGQLYVVLFSVQQALTNLPSALLITVPCDAYVYVYARVSVCVHMCIHTHKHHKNFSK